MNGGEAAHGLEFLYGGGQGGLDRGDLAKPALFSGLLVPVAEVGADFFQPRHLSWVNPKERASDASVFMRTWGSEVTAADAQRDFPQLEMGEEFIPFASGQLTVFFAGPLGPPAGDERPMVEDHVFGVDRGVAHGGVEQGVPADFRGDVRRHTGPEGVGHEDSVVEFGCAFGEVLHRQVPYGSALNAGLVDDPLDAAPPFDSQRPEPRWCAGGQHASLLEQRIEQRPARAAPEVVLLQSSRQLDAVADGDVADQAAFADHYPGELVHGVGPGPADRRAGLEFDAAEPAGVDGRPGLGQQQRLALPQQPPVAGPEHLPGYQQDQPGAQLLGDDAPEPGHDPSTADRSSRTRRRPHRLASHFSCQVSPGWHCNQSSNLVKPRRRVGSFFNPSFSYISLIDVPLLSMLLLFHDE